MHHATPDSLYHKLSLRGVGPGGTRCICCAPPPTRHNSTKRRRKIRQALRSQLRKIIAEALA